MDDLIIDLGSQRVTRAGTVIPLPALSFDLLVALVRAAPNLVSFDQLGERVWPGLVATPETIIQRVKLVRNALGDDPHAPCYIEAVRGRGYRMVARVSPLPEKRGASESPQWLEDKKEDELPSVQTSVAAAGTAAGSSRSAAPPTPRTAVGVLGPLIWITGALIVLAVLGASYWAISHYRGATKPADTASAGLPAAIHSLVVLPLENLSADKEQEYFADGMTDALTTDLAQISSLRVISRTSAMHFKDSKETLPQIGRDLQVDAVVEGTIARGENRVRVTAQLVEASTDHHLWAKTYERDMKDVLALQDEIAQDVTEQIRVKLTPKERSLLMQVHTVDPEAYDDAARGFFWLSPPTGTVPTGNEAAIKALNYFQKAIAKDPQYALAYSGLAGAFLSQSKGGRTGFAGENIPKAREAVAKALELDPSLAEAHAALAYIKFYVDWDWPGAEAEFKQAMALNPNNATIHQLYSGYLLAMTRLDEAMKECELAENLDPIDPGVTSWLGQVLYHARRYDDALRKNRQGLELYPDNPGFYDAMADVYEQKKMFAEAFDARQRALSLKNDPNVTALAEVYKRLGYRGYLLKQAQLVERAGKGALGAGGPVHVYALLNDEPRAMTALESAYNEQTTRDISSRIVHPALVYLRTPPELDSIRSSPRFRDLVRRIGFPPSPSDKY